MRRPYCWRVVLGVVLLLPSAGCVNLMPRRGILPGESGLPDTGGKETKLPPGRSAKACLEVAEELHRNGHLADAAAGYETARQYDPSVNVSARLAVIYGELGLADKALEEYRKALKDDPRNANLLNNFGYFHYNRGEWAEAEGYFRKALAADKHHKFAWNNLGNTLAQQHRYEDALAAYKHVGSEGMAYQNLAFHLMTQGKHGEARNVYAKALELEPNLRVAREALQRYDDEEKKRDEPPARATTRLVSDRAEPGRPDRAGDTPAPQPETRPAEPLPDQSPVVVPAPGQEPISVPSL